MDEMKKYIIEFSEDPCTIRLLKIKNGNECPTTEFKTVTPYKELDLEAIRNEAYEDGYKTAKVQCNIQVEKDMREVGERHYQKGLSDAWEAARKIADIWESGENDKWIIIDDSLPITFASYSASEVIEKIRQHEQEKEEQAQIGDEVECDDERYVVLQKYLNNIDELMVVLFNRSNGEINKWHLYNADGVIFKKTGRHFPEIVEVLAKMKES